MYRDQRRRMHHISQRRHHGLQRVISDAVRIDPDACRAMLASRELTPAQRLTILVALGTGLSAASFAALRRKAERAVAEAGSIEAAIKVLARARARSPEEMTNER
jgi:hypothetical protein